MLKQKEVLEFGFGVDLQVFLFILVKHGCKFVVVDPLGIEVHLHVANCLVKLFKEQLVLP